MTELARLRNEGASDDFFPTLTSLQSGCVVQPLKAQQQWSHSCHWPCMGTLGVFLLPQPDNHHSLLFRTIKKGIWNTVVDWKFFNYHLLIRSIKYQHQTLQRVPGAQNKILEKSGSGLKKWYITDVQRLLSRKTQIQMALSQKKKLFRRVRTWIEYNFLSSFLVYVLPKHVVFWSLKAMYLFILYFSTCKRLIYYRNLHLLKSNGFLLNSKIKKF